MTRLDPDLERLGDALRASTTIDLAREERAAPPAGAGREHRADAVPATRARRTRPRPRVLAGSTLGLAGIGAVLVLALGGSAAAPAFAVTKQDDGSVLVNLNYNTDQNLPQVQRKLADMGIHEQLTIHMARGAATISGPVICTPAPGVSGPTVRSCGLGRHGGHRPGPLAGNTAEGSFHLDHCVVSSDTGSGNTGSSGNTGAG